MVGRIVDFAALGYTPDVVVMGTGPHYLSKSDNPQVYGEGLNGVEQAVQIWRESIVRALM